MTREEFEEKYGRPTNVPLGANATTPNYSPTLRTRKGGGSDVEPNEYGASFRYSKQDNPLISGLKAAGNVPSSAFNLGKGLAGAVMHPIQTLQGIGKIGKGAVEKLTPEVQENEQYADAFVDYFKKRYGSIGAAAKTATEDPFGFGSDVLALVTGGAAATGKLGAMNKAISTVASPVTKAGTAVKSAVGGAVENAATGAAGITTGVGKEAYKQALQGGEDFTKAMRGQTTAVQSLQEAQRGLSEVKMKKNTEYQEALNKLSEENPKSFDIKPVLAKKDELLEKYRVEKTDDGLDFSRSPLVNDEKKVLAAINLVENWGSRKGDRTLAGIDLLKQQLRDYREPTNPTLNKFLDDMARSAQGVIKDVPGYADMESKYAAYSKFIREMERTMSLSNNSTPDQAITKLNSLLRDNSEYRRILIQEFKDITGKDLLPSIAGQAVKDFTPHGLAKVVAGGVGITMPHLIPMLAFSSPRIMGEFFRLIGATGRTIGNVLNYVNEFRALHSLPAMKIRESISESIKNPSIGLTIKDVSKEAGFQGFNDLTTKVLEKLKGKSYTSKQEVMDLTNMAELKQPERDLFRKLLADEGERVNVKEFANRVKTSLLPLARNSPRNVANDSGDYQYERVNLSEEQRGPVANYSEHIYNSPINTSAGNAHYPGETNYFAHTRVEDLPSEKITGFDEELGVAFTKGEKQIPIDQANGSTRRVIELQSDLFQKGRLEGEASFREKYPVFQKGDTFELDGKRWTVTEPNTKPEMSEFVRASDGKEEKYINLRNQEIASQLNPRKAELSRLEPYRNTWHERVIREEVKQAAIDGKTKLQFPTGETAMKIEGLVNRGDKWVTMNNELITGTNIKDGEIITYQDSTTGQPHEYREWLVTKNHGDGTFDAVESMTAENDSGFYDLLKKKDLLDDGRVPSFRELEGVGALDSEITKYLSKLSERLSAQNTVDKQNPIYRFYEKEVGRYLTNKYGAKRVTDPQGVEWWEIKITPEMKKLPIEAFGAAGMLMNNEE